MERKINCINGKVYRPGGFWSESVHALLNYLREKDFDFVPQVFGFDENGNEILSYVPGDVYNFPLTGAVATSEAMCSAAVLLRQYHDLTASFVKSESYQKMKWLLPAKEPVEVICHGDYAPYNVALNGNIVTGIFDFDAAHPGSRVWDIAYSIYCWAPFKSNPCESSGNLFTQTDRAKLFCDSYGLAQHHRIKLVELMIDRIESLVDFMFSEAENGNTAFISNIKDGHHLTYSNDIDYLKENKNYIIENLV